MKENYNFPKKKRQFLRYNCERQSESISVWNHIKYNRSAQRPFTIIQGTPNCGKTYIINKMLYKNNKHYISVDFRDFPMQYDDDFEKAIVDSCENYLQKFSDYLTQFKVIRTFSKEARDEIQTFFQILKDNSLNPRYKYFMAFKKALDFQHQYSLLWQQENPMLFLDYLEDIKRFQNNSTATVRIKDYFQEMIDTSKQSQNLHIICGTAESFISEQFHHHLGIMNEFYEVITIGNVSQAEAYNYMTNQLQLSIDHATLIYQVTGGHLFDINRIRSALPYKYTTDDIIKGCQYVYDLSQFRLELIDPDDRTLLEPIWQELYELNGEPIYLEDKPKQFEQDIKPFIEKNYLFRGGLPYLSNDIKPKGPFIIQNMPVDRLAIGVLSKCLTQKKLNKQLNF